MLIIKLYNLFHYHVYIYIYILDYLLKNMMYILVHHTSPFLIALHPIIYSMFKNKKDFMGS